MKQKFWRVLCLAFMVVLTVGFACSPADDPAADPGDGAKENLTPLVWNTFLGGPANEFVQGCALGPDRSIYVLISQESRTGYYPMLARFSASGTLLWKSYLGDAEPSVNWIEETGDIAVDQNGNAYVMGLCSATWGSPIRPFTDYDDVFVAKLDPEGKLEWNTFLGGESRDKGQGIAVTGDGSVLVTGASPYSWGNPRHPHSKGGTDIFLARLSSSGTLLWNSFTGYGTNTRCCVDGNDAIFVVGEATGTWGNPVRNFTKHDYYHTDIFAAKFNAEGSLIWNTFLGGIGLELDPCIAVDTNGNSYVGGSTWDFPWGEPLIPYSYFSDGFVAKLDAEGRLQWHTFIGSRGWDSVKDIVVQGDQGILFCGTNEDPWTQPVFSCSDNDHGFYSSMDPAGGLRWTISLGGGPSALAMDSEGKHVVAGQASFSWGKPLNPLFSPVDVFLAKFVK
jgi:hypothetical protein